MAQNKNHNMQDLEILCKHLSDKLKVKIVFEENANPSTNGDEIKLPTNLNKEILFELLGTLLHETFHIRHSDFKYREKEKEPVSDILHEVVNVLEDIRIDGRAIEKYPQARELYYILFQYALNKNKEALKGEPMPWKVLKHMIFKARAGNDFPDFKYDDKAVAIIEKLKLDTFIEKALKAKNTSTLTPLARELMALLMKYVEEQKQKGGKGQPTDFDTNELGKQGNEGRQNDKIQRKMKSMQNVREELDKSKEDYFKDAEELRRAQQSVDTAKSNISKKMKEMKEKKQAGDSAGADKLQEEIDKMQRELEDERQPTAEAAQKKLEQTKQKDEKATEDYRQLGTAKKELVDGLIRMRQNSDADEHKFGVREDIDMFGFSAIGKDDLIKPSFYNMDLELEKSLDQRLREFFVNQREERQREEEGTRLNRNRLSNLFTTGQNLFTIQKEVDEHTDVVFLLDNSGSMDGMYKGGVLVSALSTLLNALKRIVEAENLPIETAVYTFNDDTACIKNFEEDIDTSTIADRYRTGGSTQLLRSVNKMAEVFEARCNEGKKLLVVITDGEVGAEEVKQLRNQANQEITTVYIGIDACLQCQEAIDLFKETNITKEDEILDVLSNLIMQ